MFLVQTLVKPISVRGISMVGARDGVVATGSSNVTVFRASKTLTTSGHVAFCRFP